MPRVAHLRFILTVRCVRGGWFLISVEHLHTYRQRVAALDSIVPVAVARLAVVIDAELIPHHVRALEAFDVVTLLEVRKQGLGGLSNILAPGVAHVNVGCEFRTVCGSRCGHAHGGPVKGLEVKAQAEVQFCSPLLTMGRVKACLLAFEPAVSTSGTSSTRSSSSPT